MCPCDRSDDAGLPPMWLMVPRWDLARGMFMAALAGLVAAQLWCALRWL